MGFSLESMFNELISIISSGKSDAERLAELQKAIIDAKYYAEECEMIAEDKETLDILLPCPFCGGPVKLETACLEVTDVLGLQFWGVVCRNTTNLGGTCGMEQVPSASKQAAIARWNMRNGKQYHPRRDWRGTSCCNK